MSRAFHYSEDEWPAVVCDIAADAETLELARNKLQQAATWYREGAALARDKRTRQLLERAKRIIDQLQGCDSLKVHVTVVLEKVIESNQRRSGRQNPPRQIYYDLVLEVWSNDFKQSLNYSRSAEDGTLGGPCIRYLEAAMTPVLGDDMPTLEGLRKIIDRARTPRDGKKRRATPRLNKARKSSN